MFESDLLPVHVIFAESQFRYGLKYLKSLTPLVLHTPCRQF